METTRSASGYMLIEYDPDDIRAINEDQGTRYHPHSGRLLCDPGGSIVWRNFTPGIPESPPLILGWALRDRARLAP